MRTSLGAMLLALGTGTLWAAPPGVGTGASIDTTVNSTITEVTVYADRARVTRSANVSLRSGTMRFTFAKLPGWLDEGSVRISLFPANSGEVVDVQVEKTFLARADDAEIQKAEAAVTEISDMLGAIDDEKAALDAQARQADAIRVFSLDKLPKDAAVREIKPEEYTTVVKFIGSTMLDLAKSRRELDKKKRELLPELNARQQKLNDLRQRSQLEQRTVVVTLKAARDGDAKMQLNYMLPGTTWEPVHELRASQDGRSVALASYAVVTQTTGEDWEGATLTFSTQRPGTTTRIPELDVLLMGGRSMSTLVNANVDTFLAARENFDRQNGFFNTIGNAGNIEVQRDWASNVSTQRARQSQVVQVFQRVLQRGTTAQFPGLTPQTVRTDGRTVRVPIGSRTISATPKIVAAPELSLNAAQTADLNNTGGQPLLPGKVLLFTEGAFVGTTEVEFAAPGENFSVFMGVANEIKLSRTLDPKRSSLAVSAKRKRMLVAYVVAAENLSDRPTTFQLSDRIPVSETDEIRVFSVRLQPETKPDANGLLKWEVPLAAHEKKEFRIEYTMDYPGELPKPAPNAPVKSTEILYRQIDSLEQSLKK